MNVTAASATTPSFLTVYPAGVTMPTASNLNFGIQATNVASANRVTVGVGTAGQIDVYNHTGSVNVDVDVDGYYSGSGGTGSAFVPITPVRVADTRTASTVGTETPIAANTTESFLLATTTPVSGIPTTATAVATNVTVVPGAKDGYLTVYPTSDTTPPVASSVNWVGNQSPAVPNFTIVDTAGTGSVDLYASAGAAINVVIDAFGYFVAPTVATATLAVAVPSALVGAPTVTVSANGTATVAIDATVKDGAAGPLVGNDTVLFTATPSVSGDICGTFSSPTAVTDSSGVATVTYTAPAYTSTTAAVCTISVEDSLYGQVGYGLIVNSSANIVTVTASPTSVLEGDSASSPVVVAWGEHGDRRGYARYRVLGRQRHGGLHHDGCQVRDVEHRDGVDRSDRHRGLDHLYGRYGCYAHSRSRLLHHHRRGHDHPRYGHGHDRPDGGPGDLPAHGDL